MQEEKDKRSDGVSRRDFLKKSAATTVSLGVLGTGANKVFAGSSDKLRVGLIGCGGRGTGAAFQCLMAGKGNTELVALGDLFQEQIDDKMKAFRGEHKRYPMEKVGEVLPYAKIEPDLCFTGFDSYKKILSSDVDIVILGTPPGFRPEHFKAAVDAGKHVFMEKPVAVDPVGVRMVIESSKEAEKKGLAVVAGTQRRHQAHYIDIMKRISEGKIGELVAAQCYWNGGGMLNWGPGGKREEGWSDMEWQIRNWYYFVWLCGDHIVEQHVHNLDVINWAFGTHPVKALGIGGREVRKGEKYGNIYDHFTVEYEYPNGARILSMCRHMDGCSERISERIVGTNGTTYTDQTIGRIEGANAYEYEGESPDPYVQEHIDMLESIRTGKPLNEGVRVAESTLTAILGRMSAYTGRELKWDWVMQRSQLDLRPPKYEFGPLEFRPAAVPGKTALV